MANATFSIVPETLDLVACKDNDFAFMVNFDIDLTGYTFTAAVFAITRTVNSSYPGGFDSQGADVESFAITYTDLANGELSLALTETQTSAISETGTYRWYLRGVAPGTITRTYISGSFTVRTP